MLTRPIAWLDFWFSLFFPLELSTQPSIFFSAKMAAIGNDPGLMLPVAVLLGNGREFLRSID